MGSTWAGGREEGDLEEAEIGHEVAEPEGGRLGSQRDGEPLKVPDQRVQSLSHCRAAQVSRPTDEDEQLAPFL